MQDVVINQPFTLGDILFIEQIYRHYHDLGHKVIAPVNAEYLWIKEYIPYVEFVDKRQFPYDPESPIQKPDGKFHIPLRFAHPLYRGYDLHYGDDRKNWMRDKYLFLNLYEDSWKQMELVFNHAKMNSLTDEILSGIDIDNGYNLINNNFGNSGEKLNIRFDNGLPNVYMERKPGFTVIDWIYIIESAKTVHTPDTSVAWLVERYAQFGCTCHLYPRFPYLENVDYVKDHFTDQNWIFHDSTSLH